MNPWIYALIPLSTAFFAWLWWRSRVRAGAIRVLAESRGFHYLGKALPRSLQLTGSPFVSITSVWNVIDGEPRGTRIVAFDCKLGEGKASWRRTVIAVKTNIGNIAASSFDPALRIEQMKDWVLIYHPKDFALIARQLMPVTELGAYLETI